MDGTHLRRLEPPALDRGQLVRPRLLARLAGRWDRRATLVVGGPGFGKSTVLAQTLRENLLAPRGTDCFLSLTPADTEPDVLLDGLSRALRLPGGPSSLSTEDLIAGARTLPPGTCLVLDDLHELDPLSSGHKALAYFVANLPLQCSLVLSSRVFPSLALSEWMSKGAVDIINEGELRYTASEVAEVVRLRDAAGLENDHGGWPALVELGVVTGLAGNEAYLRDVILTRMSSNDRRIVAALNAIGGGDVGLLADAIGEPLDGDAHAVLSRFPMMQRVGKHGFRPHALWKPILDNALRADDRARLRSNAAQALLRRGQHDDALELFASEQDWDGVAAVISDVSKSGSTWVSFDVLDRWRKALPADQHDRPEAKFVAGIAERQGNTFDRTTTQLLVDASMAFRARGQVGAEVATLAEIAFVAREQGDNETVSWLMGRLFELDGAGAPEVAGLLRLGRAIIVDAFDEDELLLAELSGLKEGDLSPHWMSRAEWLRGHALTLLGRPEEGLAFATRSQDIAPDDFLGGRYLDAYIRWWIGVDERTLASIPFIGDELDRSPFDSVYGGATMATIRAYAGDVDLARRSVLIAQAAAEQSRDAAGIRPEYVGLLAAASAAVAIAEGDEDGAACILRTFFDAYPADTPIGRRTARRWCGLVAVLLEEQRDAVFAASYGPVIDEARRIVQWFVELRRGTRAQPSLAQPESRILNALPLSWAIEAAARYAQFDPENARLLTEHLVGVRGPIVRTMLRGIADGPTAGLPVEGAKRLLASVAVAPSEPLVVSLLGPLEITRGAVVSEAPEARRERVRQLVIAVALHGPISRERLIDLLWPDLDPAAAAQNLRTTLNYAHRLLEPDRGPGDAPFVLRQNRDQLSLAGAPWVQTDLALFDSCLDDADSSRRLGVHTAELRVLEEALEFVRGEPLHDVVYAEWAAPVIRTITTRIGAAAQRAAELRFAAGEHDVAQRNARLCLRFDPWSDSAKSVLVTSLIAVGQKSAARDALAEWRALEREYAIARTPTLAMLERRLEATG